MYILKRDGSKAEFDGEKIRIAIRKANIEVGEEYLADDVTINEIVSEVEQSIGTAIFTVEDIQDFIESYLEDMNFHTLVDVYSTYRQKRAEIRKQSNTTDKSVLELTNRSNIEVGMENSNKDDNLSSTQRDLIAGEVSKDVSRRMLLPNHIVKAHDDGIIHFHDMDYYLQHMHNCDLVNLEDMLQNGTVINGNMIDKPKSFHTACTIATQIVAQVASVQYGGQTISLSHLAPFVEVSRNKIRKSVRSEMEAVDLTLTDEAIETIVEKRVKEEVKNGVQTIQYQVETIMSTNGQSPFLSVFMYLGEVEDKQTKDDLALIIEEVLHQRILGVKNKKGVYVAPAFPKLLYVLEEDNVNGQYNYLNKLAAECSAKRLVPDYISEKKMREFKDGQVFPCMGCRSFLSTWQDENGTYKHYGRFNQGVVTLNLPDVALSSGGDIEKFWSILDERMDLAFEALMERHKRLLGTPSDVAPILWQHGALARLEPGETIDKLLFGGYSTISLGYAGIYETVKYMTGETHTSEKGNKLAHEILHTLDNQCNIWKAETNIGFSLYGSPIESTTYKFAKSLKRRFGVVEGVTDKDYITNSYHIHVQEEIDAFDKLRIEGEFQKHSQGGCISYVEVPNMMKNLDAVEALMNYIYENTMYAEINTKADYCMECGFSGEILINDDLEWYCPQCGNKDQDSMQVTRRTCGYIGSHFWNKGRTAEIAERVLHIGRD